MASKEEARQWRGTTSLLAAAKLAAQADEAERLGDEETTSYLRTQAYQERLYAKRYFEKHKDLDQGAAQLSVAEDFVDWLDRWEGR